MDNIAIDGDSASEDGQKGGAGSQDTSPRPHGIHDVSVLNETLATGVEATQVQEELSIDVHVPRVAKEILEGIMDILQEPNSERTVEWTADVPVHGVKKILNDIIDFSPVSYFCTQGADRRP